MIKAIELLGTVPPPPSYSLSPLSSSSLSSAPGPILTAPITPDRPKRLSADRSPYFTPPPTTGRLTRSKSSKRLKSSQSNKNGSHKGKVDEAELAFPPTPCSPINQRVLRSRQGEARKAKRKRPTVGDEGGGKSRRASKRPERVKGSEEVKNGRKVKTKGKTKAASAQIKGHLTGVENGGDGTDVKNAVVTKSETGKVEPIGKIHLIQERVRHDPWKMLIATCLLNKTSGRAARPIYVELLRRYPTPQALSEASVPDLSDLLYPLGLFNQRASSLIKFSNQYLSLQWPIHPGTLSSDPFIHPTGPIALPTQFPLSADQPKPNDTLATKLPEELDVTVFYGAGRYASDSFRIYSDLFVGRGGPEGEDKWVGKRKRAIERMRDQESRNAKRIGDPVPEDVTGGDTATGERAGTVEGGTEETKKSKRNRGKVRTEAAEEERGEEQVGSTRSRDNIKPPTNTQQSGSSLDVGHKKEEIGCSNTNTNVQDVEEESLLDVEAVGGYLSDEELPEGIIEEEEWRKVRPLDKELRRYLIWRWGLEGIEYDIHSGPRIKRQGDKIRLAYLLTTSQDNL